MQTILCYGDSNTWGQIPLRNFVKARFPEQIRWTGRLQTALGPNFRVIEEGNNGRTTGVEDDSREGRNGFSHLQACLDSHVPLNLVVFMLGVNDLKMKYASSPESITERMKRLVRLTKKICAENPKIETKILVISPAYVKPEFYIHGDFDYPEARAHSESLGALYKRMSGEEGVHCLDVGPVVEAHPEDGVHLDEENHARLSEVVRVKILEILKQ